MPVGTEWYQLADRGQEKNARHPVDQSKLTSGPVPLLGAIITPVLSLGGLESFSAAAFSLAGSVWGGESLSVGEVSLSMRESRIEGRE
jgi:hypothetical protein